MSTQTAARGLDRVAANELLFLRLARRAAVSRRGPGAVSFADFSCECANETCDYRVEMTPAQYESIRSSATRFVVAPRDAHVDAETERVVEWQPFYWVVEREPTAELIDFFSRSRQVGAAPHLSIVPYSPDAVREIDSAQRLALVPARGSRAVASRRWGNP